MTPAFDHLPNQIQRAAADRWAQYVAKYSEPRFERSTDAQSFADSLGKVFAVSPFVAEQSLCRPGLLQELSSTRRLFRANSDHECSDLLRAQLAGIDAESELMCRLRNFRQREMVRIAWRDIADWAPLEETLADLTTLAESCIQQALEWLYRQACSIRGTPLNQQGGAQRLVVLGMGKLGAFELNYSSDIDLIFAYQDEGVLSDKKETTYGEFYTRLARALVRVLDEPTADGFVFRVDTRLRPFGDSGPLVMSFDAMEHYYQSHAREWERYAMVKARVVAGDNDSGRLLQEFLRPFVYRRYLDYRAFGELREMKQKINQELLRKDRLDNVKLGRGGIREIEFIGQAFQLIRGGQEKRLQERSILKVLATLAELNLLPQADVIRLSEAYRFLRRVENRIQQYGDKQTHDLPFDPLHRLALADALGFADWDTFTAKLDAVRDSVHDIFEQVIVAPGGQSAISEQINWVEADAAQWDDQLVTLGLNRTQDLLPILADFQKSHAIRRLTPKGVGELNRLLPKLLSSLLAVENRSETLERLLKLLEAIASRNVYFTLLVENPSALSHLVKLASASSWICHYISLHPLLLDELLDPRSLYTPLTREQLRHELDEKLAGTDVDDVERLMIALREFKQANVLRIAASDIMGATPLMVISDYLTYLAETLIDEVMRQAWRLTAQRHGLPPGCGVDQIKGFGVVAYGKMGGLELSYASDLDLVFLYGGVTGTELTDGPSPIPCAQFYARVGKRMINLITTQMLAGELYEIDLRLRPSGNSGLLVSSLDAYETYQMNNAWTWEQQALVRARYVTGDPFIGEQFNGIRARSLGRARAIAELSHEVREMREKMRESLENKDARVFDIKQGAGGIADVEFIVQFQVLAGAHDHPQLLQWTDVVRLLENLQCAGLLAQEDATALKQAYISFREQTHRAALLEEPALVDITEFLEQRNRVRSIWNATLKR